VAKLTLADLANLTNETTVVATINANNTLIEAAIENTLSRDGTTPNTMEADLDMNSNQILNLVAATTAAEPIRKAEFDAEQTQRLADVAAAASSASAAAASATEAEQWASHPEDDDVDSDPGEFSAKHYSAKASTSASAAATSASAAATSAQAAQSVLEYSFSTNTSDSDPTSGVFKYDNGTVASVTKVWMDNEDGTATDISAFLDFFGTTGSATGRATLIIRKITEPDRFASFNVTAVTDKTGYRELTVVHLDSNSTFSNADSCLLYLTATGETGDVAGPGASTDNAVVKFDGTSGNTLQNTGVIIDDSNNITGIAALTCTTFTSTGIDDNATEEVVQIGDTILTLGRDGTGYSIVRGVTDRQFDISGGSGSSSGANIVLYGESEASFANDFLFRSGSTITGRWDDSQNRWEWQGLEFNDVGPLTCTTFTSTGIDDNATGERVQVSDTFLTIGPNDTSIYTIDRASNTGTLVVTGGSSANDGFNIFFRGGAHTSANDALFRSGMTTLLQWDDSDNRWEFQNTDIVDVGAFTCAALTSTGIDDNATGERLQIADTLLSIGTASADYTLAHVSEDRIIKLGNSGANIQLMGSTAGGGLANDMRLRTGPTIRLEWDDGLAEWDFQGNDIADVGQIELGSGGPTINVGSGTPESAVTADVGSTFHRTDGGAGTSFYVKESGTGNTGWVAK
jgi:hypothetical protein